jgi:hypothetical protein
VLAVDPQIAPATSSAGVDQQGDVAAVAPESNPLQSGSLRSRNPVAESPAAVVVRPDPAPVVASSNDAETTGALNGGPGISGNNPTMIVFPILALGLAAAAILARLTKDASARRELVAINRPYRNRADDQAQPNRLGDMGENEAIDERRALASATQTLSD